MPSVADIARYEQEKKEREAAEAARRAPVAPPVPRYVPPITTKPYDDDTDYFDSLGAAAVSQAPADNRSQAPSQGEKIASAYYIPQDPVVIAQNLQTTGRAHVPYGYFESVEPQREGSYFGNEGQQPGYFGQGFSQKEAATRARETRLAAGERRQRPKGGTFEGGEPLPNADVWNRAELHQTMSGMPQSWEEEIGRLRAAYDELRGPGEASRLSQEYAKLREQHPGKPEGYGLPEKPSQTPPPGYEWVFGGQAIQPGGPGTQTRFQDAAGRWLLQKVTQTTTGGGGGGTGTGGGSAYRPYQSYGYGGYPYGAGGVGVVPETPEPMGELSWWGPDALPPLLRQWGSWLQELVAANASTKPIPFPLQQDAEAIAAEQEQLKAAQSVTGAPAPGIGGGGMTYSQVIQQLNNSLGLVYGKDETDTSKWQRLVSSLPNADFETQQLVAGLRFNQSGQWYHQNVSQMLNPRYT